jgi:poly-gamma-glutamate synthase PgsB/CapB
MHGFGILAATVAILIVLGMVEFALHRRKLRSIPIRIHVNGTRGKSSVTRLIAAGLRAAGINTCAKTTGTLARMIMPNGAEYPVFRPAGPNVIEQVRIVDVATEYGAKALVIECMAVRPNLQWLCEGRLVRATHGVITNAREDHLDVMGPTENDVADALAGMIPTNGKLYTAERRHLAAFEKYAKDRGSSVIAVGEPEVAAVSPSDMAGFAYVEHEENVALALKVCEDLGVDRQTALRGMWQAKPDPGVLTTYELDFFGRRIYFVNGFAANDPESTERIWQMMIHRYPDVEKRIAIFNCRSDRADRSDQLGRACADWFPADHYVLMGTGTYIFARAASNAGVSTLKLLVVEGRRVDEIFESVIALVDRSALIMGMGNIGGHGLDLVRYFKNRSLVRESA